MLLQLTGPELITLATRGAGLPPMISGVQWADDGVRADVAVADLEIDSFAGRLATRALGTVHLELTFARFDAEQQIASLTVTAKARAISLDRFLPLLVDYANSAIAKNLSSQGLPDDIARVEVVDGTPLIQIEAGKALADFTQTSAFPTTRLTAVSVTGGVLQVETAFA